MCHGAAAALWLAIAGACAGGPGPATAPAPRPGEEVGGNALTITAPARLRFGQHLDVALTCRRAVDTPLRVRFDWRGPYKTVKLELTAAGGEVVPLVPLLEVGVLIDSFDSLTEGVRLRPTGPHARGVYLAPGRYRLRAVVDARRDPFGLDRFLGRLEAMPVSVAVGREPKLGPEEVRR